MAGRVFVVGSYNQDLVWEVDALPLPGETRSGNAFRTGPGGKGFNQAVAAARQGVGTVFIAALGEDALGEEARRLAKAEGIDARWQIARGIATGTAGIWVDAEGRNSIVVALGANQHLRPDHIGAETRELQANDVVLMPMEGPIAAMHGAKDAARRGGSCVILNPAPVHPELDASLLSDVDLITPNETEFVTLLARFGGTHMPAADLAQMTDADWGALCGRLPAPAVLVTLGAAGSVLHVSAASRWADRDSGTWRIATPPVNAVDTTAAGDAFNGALAAALAQPGSASLRSAASRASRVAALSTERRGAALSIPRADEVSARFP